MQFRSLAHNYFIYVTLIHLIMIVLLKFSCKYRLKFAPHYVFTIKPKMLVNIKTGRIINQITKGGSIGYVIESKFYSLSNLKQHIEAIPSKETLPF